MTQTQSTQQPASRPAPLDGLRVLDLSRVLAGPWCTMILGDLGAEVIKIESPGNGDDTRHWGPPFIGGESAYYLCANRNKKSVAVDLSTPEGQAVIRQLAVSSDILVENFKTGGLARFGLDYDSIRAINPNIIYCSISGYGRSSPLADRPGYDYVIQAEGGLMAVTGEPGGAPLKVGVAVADLFTGMTAVQAILAAVIARQRDGEGQMIDLALYDCQLAMLANVGSAYLVSGEEPARYGEAHPTVVPYQTIETRDGRIVVAVGNDRQFATLCRDLLAMPELVEDARFSTNGQRVKNRAELIPLITRGMRLQDTAYWLAQLQARGVPCGAVRSVGQALSAPETVARDMVRSVDHPSIGPVGLVGSPLKFSRTHVVQPMAPPLLGQHTDEILERMAKESKA